MTRIDHIMIAFLVLWMAFIARSVQTDSNAQRIAASFCAIVWITLLIHAKETPTDDQ